MAADIVILDIREQIGGLCNIRFACWFTIANPFPLGGATSTYPDIVSDISVGPSGQNVPAKLQTGEIAEETFNILVPISMLTSSWPTLEAYMLAVLNARKSYKAGSAPAAPQPGLKYKILHDTVTGWSA